VPGILRNYKAGSIIYFHGDIGDNIYVLKAGAVSLTYHSIETNEEVRETIQNGEFFGVKSSLAKRPREETALVIKPSQVLVLTADEFEHLVLKNVKIIQNFMRVFSNQLRRVGKMVHSFLDSTEVGDNQAELFKIGEYYLKNHKYKQALYVYQTYLKHYPNGFYASQAKERLGAVKDAIEGKGAGTYAEITKPLPQPEPDASTPRQASAPEGVAVQAPAEDIPAMDTQEDIDIAAKYYDAISLFSQEKYEEAFNLFRKLHQMGGDDQSSREYLPKIEYELGRCLIALKRYRDAISIFTNMIKKYPQDENLKDALFNIGVSYKYQGEKKKAASFFQKVLKMQPQGPVDRRAKRELAGLNVEA
jgi:CRP-like cAMP-binding protein